MYAGVVELDALADTVRTGAENDHGFTLTRTQFTFVRIAGVIVRRDRVEFGSAGIDRLENWTKIIRPTQLADRVFAFVSQATQVGDLQIGKTSQLRLLQQLAAQLARSLDFKGGLVDEYKTGG